MFQQETRQSIEGEIGTIQQLFAGWGKVDVMGYKIDLFGLFLLYLRHYDNGTAVVFCRTRAVGAFVFFIVDAVVIPIGDRAAIVPGQAGNGAAGVMFIIHAIVVRIRDGTAVIAGYTGDGAAAVVLVVYAVVVRVR